MKKPIPVQVLKKYIKGTCSPEEARWVKDWYFSFHSGPDYVSEISANEERELEERIYSRISSNIAASESVSNDGFKRGRIRTIIFYGAGIAASFFLFFGIIFKNHSPLPSLKSASILKPDSFLEIKNSKKQILKLTLPDNSMVWLNPGAEIRYPCIFKKEARLISMSGECFFEITKNPSRPFIITSRSIITKVWGTSFRVRDKLNSNSADVSVVTGKVSVAIKEDLAGGSSELKFEKGEVMLYPNQKVVYMINKHVLMQGNIEKQSEMQIWNRIDLAFENRPLKEIIPILNSKFHVKIETSNDKLNRDMLSADLTGFNLPDVLEALQKSLNVSYEMRDNSIVLEPTN